MALDIPELESKSSASKHVKSLSKSMDAVKALEGLIETTAHHMETAWGPLTRKPRRGRFIEVDFFYESYDRTKRPPKRDPWRDSKFCWGFWPYDGDDPPSVAFDYRFCAYVELRPAGELLEKHSWLRACKAKRFHFAPENERVAWLTKWLEPIKLEKLVGKDDHDAQAEYLAEWIVSSFKSLPRPPAEGMRRP